MNFTALADLHGRLPDLRPLYPVLRTSAAVLLTGDVTNFGRRRETLAMLEPLRAVNPKVLAVTGNCDHAEVRATVDELGCLLETHPVQMQDVWLMGVGGALPGPVPTPNEVNEHELETALASAKESIPLAAPIILVSHQPPENTDCDRIASGSHVGSQAVRRFIETYQPLICFTGHIHESRAIDRIGDSIIVNPGPFGGGWLATAAVEDGKVQTCELVRSR
jgi:Icc-related predicted phosphoesterase